MAATQQIARLPYPELLRCQTSEAALDQIISFKRPSSDYIDLDWAPWNLELYFVYSSQTPAAQAALDQVLNGQGYVNPNCIHAVGDYWVESEITQLLPADVRKASVALQNLDWQTLRSCMPRIWEGVDWPEPIHKLNQSLLCHPDEYHLPYLEQLVEFVRSAADNNWALIQWWD